MRGQDADREVASVLLWILLARAIRGFLRPSGTKRRRSRPWMLFTLAGIFALMSLGALASGDKPTCAGQEMVAGQSCGRPDGSSVSYEDLQKTSRNIRVLWGVVTFGGAVGFLLFGIARQTAIKDARLLIAQHQAMRESQLPPPPPPTYDWSPESLFSPPPPSSEHYDPAAANQGPNPYTNPNLYWR